LKNDESKSKYQVPNLERALKILEHLAAHPENATMAEIARRLNYPNNSVFRILSTLDAHGYLIREPESKQYSISRKLLSLGYQALVETSLIEKSQDILRSLRNETGETALLGILLEGSGVVLDQVLSHEPIKFMVSIGTKFALHTSAPAKAMLAFMDEREQDHQIKKIDFVRFNEQTICSAKEYRKELELTHQVGYGTDMGEEAVGINCVGAPVFDYRGQPCAAIWITGPEFRIPAKKIPLIGQCVIKHAETLSTRLGYHKS
jgi:DNA-binding IclR family transcriptional regulator